MTDPKAKTPKVAKTATAATTVQSARTADARARSARARLWRNQRHPRKRRFPRASRPLRRRHLGNRHRRSRPRSRGAAAPGSRSTTPAYRARQAGRCVDWHREGHRRSRRTDVDQPVRDRDRARHGVARRRWSDRRPASGVARPARRESFRPRRDGPLRGEHGVARCAGARGQWPRGRVACAHSAGLPAGASRRVRERNHGSSCGIRSVPSR